MRSRKQAMTLMEIIVVLVIVGITAAIAVPNFTNNIDKAKAATAKNNLLAIYSAQQNYRNDNDNGGGYCVLSSPAKPNCTSVSLQCADKLAAINCNLSLNIQDDGTFDYRCYFCSDSGPFSPGCFSYGSKCRATKKDGTGLIQVTLPWPIIVNDPSGDNPQCFNSLGGVVPPPPWCPLN